MKDLNIQIAIKIYEYEELSASDRELINIAREATERSYAPTLTSRWALLPDWQMVLSSPEPIRRMPPILPDFVPNGPLCSMPTHNIPTRP